MIFNPSIAGVQYKAVKNGASLYRDNLNGGQGWYYDIGTVVTLSGWIEGTQYYVEDSPGCYIFMSGDWQKVANPITKSQAQAQEVVNGLLKNNQYIFENNLLLARYANKLSKQEMATLYLLQKRLERREQQLREADVFSEMQEARIMGYSNYQGYLDRFMTDYTTGAIGLVISTTASIIIGAVVVASLGTAAYFAFKAAYEESKQDVELSRKMMKIFEKYNMTEADIQTITQETQGIVTRKVIMEKINNFLGNTKMLIIGAGLLYIGYEFYNKYIK